MEQITHASLFSGIGGAELAAAWMGWKNVFHCEINPFGRKVLEYWFPDSKTYEDITKTDFTPWRGRVAVLTGGFPCQPFSLAGKRKGADDDRYLWPQMLRAISEILPAWIVGENVAGLATMVQPGETADMGTTDALFEASHLYRTDQQFTLDAIIESLENLGYSVQTFCIPACAVGAPHRRDRLWIVAHRTDAGREDQSAREEQSDVTRLVADALRCRRDEGCGDSQSKFANGNGTEGEGSERTAPHTVGAGVRTSRYGSERTGKEKSGKGQDRPFDRAERPCNKQSATDADSDRCGQWADKPQPKSGSKGQTNDCTARETNSGGGFLLTPSASDGVMRSQMTMEHLKNHKKKNAENSNLSEQIAHKVGGGTSHLSPLFVEEMMGYPLIWLVSPFLSHNGEKKQ